MQFSFLISSERSGSNLITKLIDAHPNCCGPSPSHLFRIFALNEFKYGDLSNNNNWELLIKDTLEVLSSQFGTWQQTFTSDELLNDIVDHKAINILKYIYKNEALTNQKKQVFIKELYTYSHIDYILNNIPDAKFVYLVRDPRDTAVSFKKSPSHQKNVVEFVDIWNRDQSKSRDVLERLSSDQILLVKYEDLISDTEKSCESIAEFLGENYHDEMLSFHENVLTKKNAKRMVAWKNLDQPILKNNKEKFRTELSSEELQYVETVNTDHMSFFKYQCVTQANGDVDELKGKLNIPVKAVETIVMSQSEIEVRDRRSKAIQTIIHRDLS